MSAEYPEELDQIARQTWQDAESTNAINKYANDLLNLIDASASKASRVDDQEYKKSGEELRKFVDAYERGSRGDEGYRMALVLIARHADLLRDEITDPKKRLELLVAGVTLAFTVGARSQEDAP